MPRRGRFAVAGWLKFCLAVTVMTVVLGVFAERRVANAFVLSPSSRCILEPCSPHVSMPTQAARLGCQGTGIRRRQGLLELRCSTAKPPENLGRKNQGMPKAVPRPGGPAALSLGDMALSGLPEAERAFTVLGIETSCDDTAVAVLRSDGTVLGEAIAKQDAIHEEWGGVVPTLASKAHAAAVDGCIKRALELAFGEGADASSVDAVAAAVGPGMEICLRVGATAGRTAALQHKLPFVGVHHLEAHCLVARAPALMREGPAEAATAGSGGVTDAAVHFPFLALVISGGHCLLLRVRGVGDHHILGGTMDDTLGEAFDKCARLLDLPVGGGGGPAVEALAREGVAKRLRLAVPLKGRPGCDFSFSGLKQALRQAHRKLRKERGLRLEGEGSGEVARTAEMEEMMAENHIRGFKLDGAEGAEREEPLSHQDKADLAAAFQEAATAHLEERVANAMAACPADTRTLVVVGGVAANQHISARLHGLCEGGGVLASTLAKMSAKDRQTARQRWQIAVPKPALCTDNGIMIAWTGVERLALGISDDAADTVTRPKWPIGELQRYSAPTPPDSLSA